MSTPLISHNNVTDPEEGRGILGWLSTGQWASTAFADTLLHRGLTHIDDAFKMAWGEIRNPTQRLSYSDIIRELDPEFSTAHPVLTEVVGFVGDVVLDPLTYLSLGSGEVLRVGGKGLTMAGEAAAKSLAVKRPGIKAAELISELEKLPNAEKLFAQGFRVSMQVPKVGELTIVPPKAISKISEITGLSKLKQSLSLENISKKFDDLATGVLDEYKEYIPEKALKQTGQLIKSDIKSTIDGLKSFSGRLADFIGETFDVNWQLPKLWVNVRDQYLADIVRAEREVSAHVYRLFDGIPTERRELIGKVGYAIDDEIRRSFTWAKKTWKHTEEIVDKAGRKRTIKRQFDLNHPVFKERWRKYTNNIIDKVIKESDLNERERAALATMMQTYEEIGNLERDAGILHVVLEGYFHRRYTVAVDELGRVAMFKRPGLALVPPSSKERSFRTVKEAIHFGYEPEYDAAALYSLRLLTHRRAMLNNRLDDFKKALLASKDITPRAAAAIERDIARIGDSRLGHIQYPAAKTILDVYDRMLGWFKKSATILKPSFGVRQISSNTVQAALVHGLRAFKMFDPRSLEDSWVLIRAVKNPGEVDLGNVAIKSALGHIYKGEEVVKYMHDYRIINDTALGGELFSRDVVKELKRQEKLAVMAEKTGVSEAYLDFVTKAAGYWNMPSQVENFFRAAMFVNGLRLGYAPDDAAKLVNKALFDYTQGLSAIEKKIMRRIVPFYTFQRFAVPLLVTSAATKPGRIAFTQKSFETLMDVWGRYMAVLKGNDPSELTSQERAVLPGWLLEQPYAFVGFDKELQAHFNTFNNFSPLDTLNFADPYEGDGFRRTIAKTILSTLSPFLKLPIEIAANQNFFTGRVITDDEYKRGISRQGQAGDVAKALDRILPEVVKHAIGWEVAKNPVDGKEWVYVNPWLAHVSKSFFPVIKEYINLADDRYTPGEAALRFLSGVATFKMNLKEQKMFRLREAKADYDEAKYWTVKALKEGRDLEYERAYTEFQRALQRLRLKVRTMSGPIRG